MDQNQRRTVTHQIELAKNDIKQAQDQPEVPSSVTSALRSLAAAIEALGLIVDELDSNSGEPEVMGGGIEGPFIDNNGNEL